MLLVPEQARNIFGSDDSSRELGPDQQLRSPQDTQQGTRMNEVEAFRDLRLAIPAAREPHCKPPSLQPGSDLVQDLVGGPVHNSGESSFFTQSLTSRLSNLPPPHSPQPPGLPRPANHQRRRTVDGSEQWPSVNFHPSSSQSHHPQSVSPLSPALRRSPAAEGTPGAHSVGGQGSGPLSAFRSQASSPCGSFCCNFHCSCRGGSSVLSPGHASATPLSCSQKSDSPTTSNRRASFSGRPSADAVTESSAWGSPRSAPPGEKGSPFAQLCTETRSEVGIQQCRGFNTRARPHQSSSDGELQLWGSPNAPRKEKGIGPFQRQSWKQAGSGFTEGPSQTAAGVGEAFLNPWSTFPNGTGGSNSSNFAFDGSPTQSSSSPLVGGKRTGSPAHGFSAPVGEGFRPATWQDSSKTKPSIQELRQTVPGEAIRPREPGSRQTNGLSWSQPMRNELDCDMKLDYGPGFTGTQQHPWRHPNASRLCAVTTAHRDKKSSGTLLKRPGDRTETRNRSIDSPVGGMGHPQTAGGTFSTRHEKPTRQSAASGVFQWVARSRLDQK